MITLLLTCILTGLLTYLRNYLAVRRLKEHSVNSLGENRSASCHAGSRDGASPSSAAWVQFRVKVRVRVGVRVGLRVRVRVRVDIRCRIRFRIIRNGCRGSNPVSVW